MIWRKKIIFQPTNTENISKDMLDSSGFMFTKGGVVLLEQDIKTFLNHSKDIILDSLNAATTKYILDKLLVNFKHMCSKSTDPYHEAAIFFENTCNSELENIEEKRLQSCKYMYISVEK